MSNRESLNSLNSSVDVKVNKGINYDVGPASVVNMSQEEVLKWIESKGLESLAAAFSKTDGQKLWNMKYLSDAAPEYFYKEFKETFGANLDDIIQLHAALRSLR